MYYHVTKIDYVFALCDARRYSENIRASVTHPTDLPDHADYYLHADEKSGFGVAWYDEDATELIGVFSTVKGRGDEILTNAESLGANVLDCFDGYLTNFYTARGWVEYNRVRNYVDGQPDVVYLSK